MDRRPAALLTAVFAVMALVGLPAPPATPDALGTAGPLQVLHEVLPREPQVERRTCKPTAPVAVELVQFAAGPAGQRSLAFRLDPRQELSALTWSLELGDGATLLAGDAVGDADPRLGARTAGKLSVALPPGAPFAEVVLRAHGETADGERISVERALTWGTAAPVVPVHQLIDTTTGAQRKLALLPTVHEPGR